MTGEYSSIIITAVPVILRANSLPLSSRSKPANRPRKARSTSTDSVGLRRKSKSPSTNPKLYPIGDGTWAPLDYLISLRTGQSQNQAPIQNQHAVQNQTQGQDTSAERMNSVPLNLNTTIAQNTGNHDHSQPPPDFRNSYANNNLNPANEHSHQSQDYRHSLSFLHDRDGRSSSIVNAGHPGGFDFPMSTARSTSLARGGTAASGRDHEGAGHHRGHGVGHGGGIGIGHGVGLGIGGHAYGPNSSRFDPMLLSSTDPFGQTHLGTTPHSQRPSDGVHMPSVASQSQKLPTLPNDVDGAMMNDASSYLHDMDAVPPSDPLPNPQAQGLISHRYLPYGTFPPRFQDNQHASPSKSTMTPEETGQSRANLTEPYESSVPTDRREDDYLIHSQDHRKKFLGASSSQVFVKWLDEESGGLNPSSHLKHGMTSAEEMILPGQLELCQHPLPSQPDVETYVSTYFRTFHILYPVVEEAWLRLQLNRPKGPHAAGGDFATPAVVYLVVSLGASMTASAHASAVSETYLNQAWKALSVILGRPFRSSVQALVLMAVALRLVS